MDRQTPIQKVRRGRPPKGKSDATLTRRLQIVVQPGDIERINAIMERTSANSMGDVIRNAIRAEFERLETEQRAQSSEMTEFIREVVRNELKQFEAKQSAKRIK